MKKLLEIYRVGRNSVSTWFNRYESDGIGGLHTAVGKGRPSLVRIDNESEVKQIEKWVEDHPQNLNPVLDKIENELGKKMSKRTLKRLLKKRNGAGKDFVKSLLENQHQNS